MNVCIDGKLFVKLQIDNFFLLKQRFFLLKIRHSPNH